MKHTKSQIARAANKAKNAIDPKNRQDARGNFQYVRLPGAPTLTPTSGHAVLERWLNWYDQDGEDKHTDYDLAGAWATVESMLTGDGDHPLDTDPRKRGQRVMHKRHVAKKKTASSSRPGSAKRLVGGKLV